MKKRPMVLIFTGILSGTAVVWNVTSMTTAFYFFAGILFLVILLCNDRRYGLVAAGIICGIVFSTFSKISMNMDLAYVSNSTNQYQTGEVVKVSETKKGKQALLLKCKTIEGKVLLYTKSEKKVNLGDILSFEGKLKIWEDATNPGQFSSKHYYFSKGIYYYAYVNDITIKGHREQIFGNLITDCQDYLKNQLKIQYKEEVREFLNGMILGDKKELSDEIKDDFKESGLIHLLAVSGLHISLAGRSLYQFIRRFCGSFTISTVFGLSGAIFYCILSGMSVSSSRALIMLGIYFVSEILGEHYDLLSSASFAGTVLLILRPYRIYDTGFLYSFTAVFVIGCYQMIKPKFKKKFQKIKESMMFCLWIEIGMFPIMIYFQYEAPLFSFVANVIAVPLATTAFSMALYLIFLPYTMFHQIISWMVEGILLISRQSYGMLTVGHVPFLWVVLFYGILYLCVQNRTKMNLWIRMGFIYIGIFTIIILPLLREKTIAFLDVGQGDCFVADTQAGLIVSDGGSSSKDQIGRYTILAYMKYLGYQNIKVALISHMDMDHYSGILELLEMGRIKYLGLPDIKKDAAMKQLIRTAYQHNTKVFYLCKENKICTKDTSLTVLHPEQSSELEKNAASLVLQGKVLGHTVLLTGDVEKEGEEQLLSEKLKNVEILKVSHHGSKNSTREELLQKIKPEYAVISCGENNRYGHPHRETIKRLELYRAKIVRTDKKGAIIFERKRDG